MWKKLWADEDGAVLTLELVLLILIVVVGLGVGMQALVDGIDLYLGSIATAFETDATTNANNVILTVVGGSSNGTTVTTGSSNANGFALLW